MPVKYSQFKAMFSITKASLKAIFRSPSSVLFGFGFPLVFILVFGFIGNGGGFSLDVALAKNTDTTTEIYKILRQVSVLNFIDKPDSVLTQDLSQGDITAIISIEKNTAGMPAYTL